ncbi:MFS-type transporter SLC18B1-like isoform X2 [Amphibalanus amphitrite]|uniref:MFS-type transporter SLC18B1-like isoform X2 n=1 Tax=Amphibalanus amphitrite TaxID=1232801 RepID=UPI001C91263A|nr:MFS-type transporter SLC18B1-like isoform X2 [Amphibalanus amphitrite]
MLRVRLLIYVRDLQMFTVYCFVIRVMMGTGSGANLTSTFTYVASTFTEKISLTLGLLEVFTSLGLCVGPALGGLLFEVGGYSMPFYAVGAFLLLLLPINALAMPKIEGRSSHSLSYGRALIYPPMYVTLGAVAMVTMVFAFFDATVAQHLADRFTLSPRPIGLILLLFAVCYGLSSPVFGRISDALGKHRLIMAGVSLTLGSVALVAVSPPDLLNFIPSDALWVTLLSLCLVSVASAATLIPTFAVLCDLVKGPLGFPEDVQTDALVSAAFQTFFYLGCVIGAGGGGYLVDHLGYSNAVGVVSAVVLFWGLLTLTTAAAMSCCSPSNSHQPLPIDDKLAVDVDTSVPTASVVIDDPAPEARARGRPENLDLSQLSIRESGGYKTFLPEIGSLSPPPERAEMLPVGAEGDRSSEESEANGVLVEEVLRRGVNRIGSRERLGGSRERLGESREKLRRSKERMGGSRERLRGSRERLGRSRERLGRSVERISGWLSTGGESSGERGGGSRERVATSEERAGAQEETRIAEMIKNADLHELQELLRSPMETSPDFPPPW